MKTPAPRCPGNAPGPFYGTGECMECGAPELEAPELLAQLTPANHLTYFVRQPCGPEETERACRAIEVCCVAALRYGGTDPVVLRRLGNAPEVCDHPLGEEPTHDRSLVAASTFDAGASTDVSARWWRFWRR